MSKKLKRTLSQIKSADWNITPLPTTPLPTTSFRSDAIHNPTDPSFDLPPNTHINRPHAQATSLLAKAPAIQGAGSGGTLQGGTGETASQPQIPQPLPAASITQPPQLHPTSYQNDGSFYPLYLNFNNENPFRQLSPQPAASEVATLTEVGYSSEPEVRARKKIVSAASYTGRGEGEEGRRDVSFRTKNGDRKFNAAKKTAGPKASRATSVFTQSKPATENVIGTDDGLSDADIIPEEKISWSSKRSGFSDDKRGVLAKIK